MLAPRSTPLTSPTHRVLILEDDRFFQEAIKKGLSMVLPDAIADVCTTTSQAIERVTNAAQPYLLAIVDLTLPDSNGINLIRLVSRSHPKTAVMVLSVSSDERRVLEAVRAGAIGYVVKGDISLSITKAIDQILSGLHPISPALAGYFLRLAGRETLHAGDAPMVRLTPREIDLLREFAMGKSYREAAEAMNISVTTVRTHTGNLYRKLGVKSGLRAVSIAKEHGLI